MIRATVPLTAVLAAALLAATAASAADNYKPGLVYKEGCRRVKPAGARCVRITPQGASKGVLFSDNFDGSFPGIWAPYGEPYWGPTTYRKVSGTRSIYCSQLGSGKVVAPGPYPAGMDGWITYGPFSLAGVTSGKATFNLWNISQKDTDEVFAGWSLDDSDYDGGAWSGSAGSWNNVTVNMVNSGYDHTYLGAGTVYFSFSFTSDAAANTYEGAYIDDLSVTTNTTSGTYAAVGTVKDQFGRLVRGATVSTSLTKYAYTGGDGKYNLSLSSGTYTLVPKKPGYTFTPATKNITIGSGNVTANFVARKASGDGVVKYWAVLVGIADYVGTGNDLSYCDDDARDVRAALLAAGWPDANITMLIDSQATKTAIKNAILAMKNSADADDVCLFFQSSHGSNTADVAPLDEPDSLDEVLCTYDIDTEEINDDELGRWLSLLPTSRYVVLIDACYSGGNIKARRRHGSFSFGEDIAGAGAAGTVGTRDLDDNGAGVVVTACRDTELSEETSDFNNGVFAYYALQGMTTGNADVNDDGWISAEEVYNYSRPYVTEYNPDQTLDIYDGYPGECNFARLPTIISASTPKADATGVALASNVTLTFRKLVNQANAQAKFRLLTATGATVPGTFSWTTAKRTMVFNPTANLRGSDQYTVKILEGLVLNDATVVARSESFTFQTIASGAPALAVTAAAAPTASGATQITLSLSAAATVSGSVCNLAGREVAVLDGRALESGVSTLLWSGRSSRGSKVPAGQYLVRLTAVDGAGNTARCLVSVRR